jgi:DNA-binding transcriptional ArsR family regulator
MDALPAFTPADQPTLRDGRREAVGDERRRRLVVEEEGHPKLAGTRRELSPETRELLYAPIPVGADAHPIAWRCLLRLVFARYSAEDAARLLRDPAVHGLEHIRSSRGADRRLRISRSPETVTAMLTRQWARAVNAVVGMIRGVPGEPDEGLVELVAGVQALADTVAPSRWAGQAGPADRLVLNSICLLVLNHGRAQVGASVRRIAELTGLGAATASRALRRLSQPDAYGYTWLIDVAAATGRHAAIWQLAAPSDGGIASNKMHVPYAGGTQGNPPPKVPGALHAILEHDRADVWTSRSAGLGHHAARTHAALLRGAHSIDELSRQTGYAARTARTHLDQLRKAGLALLNGDRVQITDRSLADAAAELGVDGVGLARQLRHRTEREAYAWWTDELQWRRATGKPRFPRLRRSSGTASAFVDETKPYEARRQRYGRFPVRPGGRSDFAAALRVVRDHVSRVMASSPCLTRRTTSFVSRDR